MKLFDTIIDQSGFGAEVTDDTVQALVALNGLLKGSRFRPPTVRNSFDSEKYSSVNRD